MPTRFTNATQHAVATLWLVFGALVVIPVCSMVVAQDVANSSAGDVHIGVLALFHPHQFTVGAAPGSALVLHASAERITLEKSSGFDSAAVRIAGNDVEASAGERVLRASTITITGRTSDPVDFILAVPNKITRHFHGTLEIKPSAGILLAIVAMERETAVASVVAAESVPDTPIEALKAQAVATRSYLIAGRGRHREFDFCDTTHCQFLREPPAPGSAVAAAVAATRDLVLAYDSHPFAAMYTRSCSGRTRTPEEVGLSPSDYPYFSVECAHCRSQPVRWSSRMSAQDAASLHPSNESARLNIDRRLGWSVVPSNNFVAKTVGDQTIVEGTGQGHGIGLCQSGAKAMAEAGADFRQILSHYYPNTNIVSFPAGASFRTANAQ